MVRKIFIGIGFIIALALIWLTVIDGSYDVKRSIVINSPQGTVYDTVADLNTWSKWSPWIIMEPSANITVTGNAGAVGNFYSWQGELVGSGEMENTEVARPERLTQSLTFRDPFPSESTVYWEMESQPEGTKITWGLKGKMPFLFKFMAKQMEPMIGMDYERGLRLLKDYVENGTVLSEVEVKGVERKEAFKYLGIMVSVPWEEIGTAMGENLQKIRSYMEENNYTIAGAPLSIYNDLGLQSDKITFTSAIPYTGDAEGNDEIIAGAYPVEDVFVVNHLGKYEHIGGAWAAAFSAARYQKIKLNSALDAYEVYLTDPTTETDTSKWLTSVMLPVK